MAVARSDGPSLLVKHPVRDFATGAGGGGARRRPIIWAYVLNYGILYQADFCDVYSLCSMFNLVNRNET